MRRTLIVSGAMVLALCSSALAADDAPFTRKVIIKATAISSELLETLSSEDIEIKSQAMIQSIGQIILPINVHFNEAEIVEAATIKSDGRRIVVPKDRILESALPNAATLGIFQADVKVRTIVFPDVAVGDTVHYAVRIREKSRGIAGGFSFARVFSPSSRFGAIEISLDAPEGLQVQKTVVGFSEASEVVKGRRLTKWTLGPQPYRATEPGEVAAIDHDPMVMVSSYPSDEVIGRNFFAGAEPKSKPTDEIRALADDITKGLADRKEQARAIYDYVSTKVRYMAIFLGTGGFVPHEAGEVLSSKYGDCKDHATLMRALLLAKGIASDYALISLGTNHKSFATPAPESYNHVILYLPEFDLYADPTNQYTAFGVLTNLSDKPVLRVGPSGVVVTRTPPLGLDTMRATLKADVTLRADGTPIGTATIEGKGPAATLLRSEMAQASVKGGAEFAKAQLKAANWRGTGAVEQRDSLDHSEPYVVKTSFDLTNRFFGKGPNTNAIPVGPRLIQPIHTKYDAYIRDKRTQDFICAAGTYETIVDLHLPEGTTLSSVPNAVSVDAPLASYTASYAMAGQVLHVERRFVLKVASSVCTSEMAQAIKAVVQAAVKDSAMRLVFGGEKPVGEKAEAAEPE